MTSARLLPRSARLYPGLELGRAYRVLAEEPTGIWIEAAGDPFLNPGRRFVDRRHFDVTQDVTQDE